jgi:glycosyltransferase involved in cell wall biosynthesis
MNLENARPLVSVLITTWNAHRYLQEAIESALSQTYPNIEILVVDDGSTDETPDICASYLGRVRYFRQERDGKGGALALMRAFDEARGTYLAPLDHDDRWHPEKIGRQVSYMESHPETGAVFTRANLIDPDGHELGLSPLSAPSGDVFHMLLTGNRYFHSAALYPAAILDTVGRHDPNVGIGDWDLWLKISRHHPIAMIGEPLVEYRVHPTSFSKDLRRMGAATRRVLENQRVRLHPGCRDCRRSLAIGMETAAATYLQHFHREARHGSLPVGLPSLRDAFAASRKTVAAPSQLAAITKSLGVAAARGFGRLRRAAPTAEP